MVCETNPKKFPYQVMPAPSPEDRARIKESIRQFNVLLPIEKDEHGNILDGHTRLELVEELRAEGVNVPDPVVHINPGLSEDKKIQTIYALNADRRHLTREAMREIIAVRLKVTPEKSDRQIAESLGVNHETVGAVRKKLESTGEIRQLEKTKGADGKTRRRRVIIARDRREQTRAIKALASLPVEAIPEKMLDVRRLERIAREYTVSTDPAVPISAFTTHDANCRLGDFREVLADIDDGSVALMSTDPPYTEEFLHVWEPLGATAARVLRPGGFLIAYCGQYHLPACLSALSQHLDYWWMAAVIHNAATNQIQSRCIHNGWKPVLIFRKPGGKRAPFFRDVFEERHLEKSHHPWQQNLKESERIIEAYSAPGELVVDPFLGSGTTAVAAQRLGRKFVGSEINPAALAMVKKRLEDEMQVA